MKDYGSMLQDSGFTLTVSTDHARTIGFGIQGYSKRMLVLLTPKEVENLISQLTGWLLENTKGESK